MDLLPALLRRWKIRMGISERSVVDFLPGKPLFKSHRKLWVSGGASNIQLKGCILPGVEQEQCHCLRVSYMPEMLTGWILKAAFVVIFSTSQERSPNIQVVLWLAQGHVSRIQTQPWLRLYCSTSRDHPLGFCPRRLSNTVTGSTPIHQTSWVWILVPLRLLGQQLHRFKPQFPHLSNGHHTSNYTSKGYEKHSFNLAQYWAHSQC